MKHREARNVLYEYARGEVHESARKEIEDHLQGCNACYAEYQLLKEGMRLVPSLQAKPSDDRPEAFWQSFAGDVERQIQDTNRKRPRLASLWETLEFFYLYRRPYVGSAAGGLALVVLLLLAFPFNSRVTDTRDESPGRGEDLPIRMVREDVGNYLRKSKVLLVGITNIRTDEGRQIDLSVERQAARQLVNQARNFDGQEMDERSRLLVGALEKILIELANMEERADIPDVEILRSGIRQENMLFKIRMAESTYNNSIVTARQLNKEIQQ